MVACLFIGARRFGNTARFDDRFRKRIWRIVAASIAMGLVLVFGEAVLEGLLNTPWWRGLGLLFLVILGAVSYFGLGQLFGAFRLAEFKAAMQRGGT